MSRFVAKNCPELTFEIDFDTAPTSTPRTYEDVTSDVRQLTYARAGRNSELQRTDPGTLTGLLNNRHGYYDPGNTASVYYPGVKRMRWCRASAVWAGVTYRRWTGLIETWSQTWPEAGKDATVTITASDALKALNLFDLSGLSYGAQLTSARVSAVLTDAGITASTVATGETSVAAIGPFAEGSGAFAHLIAVEETENGLLFAEGDGNIVFQNRNYRLTAASSLASQGTIGDAGGNIRYRTATLTLDDAYLWNTVGVTPSGGTVETATDGTSELSHYARRLSRSSLSSSQTDALNTAQYLVQRYADPTSRVPQVELIGVHDDGAKWPTILAAVNSQRFVWNRAAIAAISEQVFVERVSDVVTPGHDWRVTFDLSPAIDQAGWVVGDAINGVVGSTTRVVY